MEKKIMHEFGLCAKLCHNNILCLIGYCDYNGAPTIISLWMEGGTILDYCIKHKVMSVCTSLHVSVNAVFILNICV